MGFRLPGMGDWTMPTATPNTGAFDSAAYLAANPDVAAAGMDAFQHYQQYGQNEGRQGFFNNNTGPGTYAEYMASHPDAWAGNGTDYLNVIRATYGTDPGNYEDWSWGKEGDDIRQQYDKLVSGYQQGQALIDTQYKFAPDQKLTAQQLGDLGIDLHSFQGWDKQNAAWAGSPVSNDMQLFLQNPDGTYTPASGAPAGLSGGYKTIQVNNPNQGGSWTDYMDAAITVASALGAGYAGAGALGALGAVGEGAALGSTGAGSIDAYMAGAGLDAGTFGGSAFTMPGLAEGAVTQALPYTQAYDAANLFANGITNPAQLTDILTSTGMDSFLAQDMASLAAQGLSAEQIASTLAASYTPAELAGTGIESLNWGAATKGMTVADALRYANQARQGLGVASALSKLAGGGATGGATGGAKTGGTSGLSPQEIAKYLSGMASPAQAGPVPYQIKMNQNPFTFDIPGQTKATEGMYDVSGVNPMANALRKNNGTNS